MHAVSVYLLKRQCTTLMPYCATVPSGGWNTEQPTLVTSNSVLLATRVITGP